MARSKGIAIPITGINAPLRKSIKEAQKDLTAFGKASSTWSKAQSLYYGIAGAAAVKFGEDVVRTALEDERSQALLAKQLQNTTNARDAQIKGAEDYIRTTMDATNITDDDLRPALAKLVRVTKDQSEAQKLLTLATDVSIGSGRDLNSVTTALSRAYIGNYTALTRLGIVIDKSRVSTEGFAAVQDQLNQQFGGAAAAAADTVAGRVKNLTIRWHELKEELGKALLPVVDNVVTSLANAGDIAQKTGNPFAGLLSVITSAGSGIENFIASGIGLNQVGDEIVKTWDMVYQDVFGNQKEVDAANAVKDLAAQYQKLSDILVTNDKFYKGTAQALEDQADAAARAEREVGYLKDQYKAFSDITLKQVEDQKKAQEEAAKDAAARAKAAAQEAKDRATKQKAAREDYQKTAETLRKDLAGALENAREQLRQAQDEAKQFGESLANSFGVSLSDAYSAAKDGEDAYTAALKGRQDAYAALDVAKQGNDLNAYLKAVQDVATAEQAVTDAQKARVTPAAAFQKQIEDAKNFGSNLKTLIGQGLGQSGLQQLLDLGPTAGAEVTKALLDGTAGFTVSDLNASLQGLADVQAGLAASITSQLAPKGAINSAQSMVDAFSSASIGAPGVGQGFTINITAGVGDPVEIGRQVKRVLSDYDNRAGSLIVQGGKKKGRR